MVFDLDVFACTIAVYTYVINRMANMEKSEGKHVGIWIRVSTEEQVKGDSPEHHEKRALCYAESKDWTVKEVYRLEAVSGKSVMEPLWHRI